MVQFWAVTKVRNHRYILAFGANVRKLREERGLSQEELYDIAGLSKNQIGNIERGEVNASLSSIYAIAKALKVDVAELFVFNFAE